MACSVECSQLIIFLDIAKPECATPIWPSASQLDSSIQSRKDISERCLPNSHIAVSESKKTQKVRENFIYSDSGPETKKESFKYFNMISRYYD